MVNKAFQLFKRVICRECGHILFPIKKNTFNRYNSFECCNPICLAQNRKIYLSKCHHCKKGIIDSRDSQRCSNGWIICPTCLSCCTDILIEQQVQKHERRNMPVPEYIQRQKLHGHNDKQQYFCPKCGGKIIKHYDCERGEEQIFCDECKEIYPHALLKS